MKTKYYWEVTRKYFNDVEKSAEFTNPGLCYDDMYNHALELMKNEIDYNDSFFNNDGELINYNLSNRVILFPDRKTIKVEMWHDNVYTLTLCEKVEKYKMKSLKIDEDTQKYERFANELWNKLIEEFNNLPFENQQELMSERYVSKSYVDMSNEYVVFQGTLDDIAEVMDKQIKKK